MPERNLYLNNLPLDDAIQKYFNALEGLLIPRTEKIAAEDSFDRITAKAIYADCSSPPYNAAAMDGIAVIAACTADASETNPITLFPLNTCQREGCCTSVKTSYRDAKPDSSVAFTIVNTGDPVLPPWDAVIMAEDITPLDDGSVQIREAATAWQHVRPIGEDIVAGEMILPGNHCIKPADIGVMLSGGLAEIEVIAKPRVAILPTGSEFLTGRLIESNSRMLAANVKRDKGIPRCYPPTPDNIEKLRYAILDAVKKHDLVLVNAGSSAGTEDYTVQVLRELGEVIVHGIAIKPGKPVILAIVDKKPVIGIPGYPVSAYLDYELFAGKIVKILGKQAETVPVKAQAVIARRIVSSLKHREYVRIQTGRVDNKLIAVPLARGAGAAMSLVRANGFCIIEQNSEGIEAGQTADVELFDPLDKVDKTILVIGSHDLILDLIADLMQSSGNASLASTHTGSMAGLMSLKRNECHITPIHLLDEESGTYNIPFVKRLFPQTPMLMIKGVGRIQGLMIKKGNPLKINSLSDLPGCRYINRQRGAGTRLFLDYKLKQAGILPEQVQGYEREAATHMAAAAVVAGGGADTAMGIYSAAKALGLDFIPLGNEEYDFVLYPEFLKLPHIKRFLEILTNSGFHKQLEILGGYTWDKVGSIINIV